MKVIIGLKLLFRLFLDVTLEEPRSIKVPMLNLSQSHEASLLSPAQPSLDDSAPSKSIYFPRGERLIWEQALRYYSMKLNVITVGKIHFG